MEYLNETGVPWLASGLVWVLLGISQLVWPILAAFMVLAAIVMIARPRERGEVRTAGVLFALSLFLLRCCWAGPE